MSLPTHSLGAARAAFSRLVDRALAGEPQRVTRNGGSAVVIVSEAQWKARAGERESLGSYLLRMPAWETGAETSGAARFDGKRPLGADFV